MLLLDKPSAETFQESDDVKFCHTVCVHHADSITLCGAYKPILCNVMASLLRGDSCPVCEKKLCPDCKEMTMRKCPRCGL
jgi:hypothetical protein